MLATLTSAGMISAAEGLSMRTEAAQAAFGHYYDLKEDFKAVGDGRADDTRALQTAIRAGSDSQRPVLVPPGVYPISRPLTIPSNTMLIGSAPGLGFGCRIEPMDCPAFIIGGAATSFHCAIENLMIWPKGSAPDYIISIDNSYSITFRNVRIHDAPEKLKRAAVVLLGDAQVGGHGRCANVIWDNLVVRNDNGQPPVAVLAERGCGSHRFLVPCLENYAVLLDWRGGQIDMIVPYTERAGRFGVDCNLEGAEDSDYLSTFGGFIDCAPSGLGCAIRSTTRNFNSFGTRWGASTEIAAYVYAPPLQPVNFYGIVPNLGKTGKARFAGVAGWRKFVNFARQTLWQSRALDVTIPGHGVTHFELAVTGVEIGEYWARATLAADLHGAQLSAFVSAKDTVTVVAQNAGDQPIHVSGTFNVECGPA